jgi:hypothetical protein
MVWRKGIAGTERSDVFFISFSGENQELPTRCPNIVSPRFDPGAPSQNIITK